MDRFLAFSCPKKNRVSPLPLCWLVFFASLQPVSSLLKNGVSMYSLPASGKVKAVYFSLGTTPSDDPQLDCVKALCDLFASAKKSVLISIYSLTEPKIVDSIIDAHLRGVDVRLVVDLTQSKGKAMSVAITRLQESGVNIRVAKKQKAAMHNKVAIFDGKIVATGSFNYSSNAHLKNDENLIVIYGTELAESFKKYVFDRVVTNETLKK